MLLFQQHSYNLAPNFKYNTLPTECTDCPKISLQKCCGQEQLFSYMTQRCVPGPVNASSEAGLYPDPAKFQIHYGLPCPKASYQRLWSSTAQIDHFYPNGSWSGHLDSGFGQKHLELGEYCLDVEKETHQPLLMLCPSEYPTWDFLFSLLFICGSLLAAVDLARHKVRPGSVHDKHLTRFLVLFMLAQLFYFITRFIFFFSSANNFVFTVIWQMFIFFSISAVSRYSIMCINAWRHLRAPDSPTESTLHVCVDYTLLGLPLMCVVAFFIDSAISGNSFIYRFTYGSFWSNPWYLYFINVMVVLDIVWITLLSWTAYLGYKIIANDIELEIEDPPNFTILYSWGPLMAVYLNALSYSSFRY